MSTYNVTLLTLTITPNTLKLSDIPTGFPSTIVVTVLSVKQLVVV